MSQTFTIPCDMHIAARGELDIPAGATIHVGDDGEYIGFVTDAGEIVAHRGHEADFQPDNRQSVLRIEHANEPAADEQPAATPAAVAHAEETGVDLTQVEGSGADGKILKADVAAAAEAATGPTAEALSTHDEGQASG